MNQKMLSQPANLPVNDPGFALTPSALSHIRRSVKKATGEPIGIRIGVRKAGCNGYEYVLELALASDQKPWDFLFHFEEIAILIDQEIYLKFLKGGTLLDFKKEGLKEGLCFDNPNVGYQCGCGESFRLRDSSHDELS